MPGSLLLPCARIAPAPSVRHRVLEEGWYLMSTSELEHELRRVRSPEEPLPPSGAIQLDSDEALAFRDAGNLPDEHGRTLRLVLHAGSSEAGSLDAKRLAFEPDYLDRPRWRREGSRPVNLVPLRPPDGADPGTPEAGPWWEEPAVAGLEEEWRRTGAVAGMAIPGEIRSFVFKTVLVLRAARRPVNPDSVGDAISRWLRADQAEQIRRQLRDANLGDLPPSVGRT